VGKNVTVTVQTPIKDEEHTVSADPRPYTVTVSKTPISDRGERASAHRSRL